MNKKSTFWMHAWMIPFTIGANMALFAESLLARTIAIILIFITGVLFLKEIYY